MLNFLEGCLPSDLLSTFRFETDGLDRHTGCVEPKKSQHPRPGPFRAPISVAVMFVDFRFCTPSLGSASNLPVRTEWPQSAHRFRLAAGNGALPSGTVPNNDYQLSATRRLPSQQWPIPFPRAECRVAPCFPSVSLHDRPFFPSGTASHFLWWNPVLLSRRTSFLRTQSAARMKPKGDTFFRALLLGLRAFVSLDDVAGFVWWMQQSSVVAFSTGG